MAASRYPVVRWCINVWKWILSILIGAVVMAMGVPLGCLGIFVGVFGLYVLPVSNEEESVQDTSNHLKPIYPESTQVFSREVVMRDGVSAMGIREIVIHHRFEKR